MRRLFLSYDMMGSRTFAWEPAPAPLARPNPSTDDCIFNLVDFRLPKAEVTEVDEEFTEDAATLPFFITAFWLAEHNVRAAAAAPAVGPCSFPVAARMS